MTRLMPQVPETVPCMRMDPYCQIDGSKSGMPIMMSTCVLSQFSPLFGLFQSQRDRPKQYLLMGTHVLL